MITLILIVIGILLVVLNCKEISRGYGFLDTYEKASSDITNTDMEIIQIRKEFAETILELQSEIEKINDKFNNLNMIQKEQTDPFLDIEQMEEIEFVSEDDNEISNGNDNENHIESEKILKNGEEINNIKINEVEKLIKEGMSIENICEELGIGKGEVLLIEKLYLK